MHAAEIKASNILSNAEDPWFDYDNEDVRVGFTPFVYEMHGNASYMHCTREKDCPVAKKLIECPSIEEFVAAAEAAPER